MLYSYVIIINCIFVIAAHIEEQGKLGKPFKHAQDMHFAIGFGVWEYIHVEPRNRTKKFSYSKNMICFNTRPKIADE